MIPTLGPTLTPTSPTAPTPVMDVVAPPVEKKADAPASEADPLDKLVAAAQKEQQDQQEQKGQQAPIITHNKPAKHQQAAVKHDDQTHSGVGAAITATVIIVLALAALATYAYIQTNK